tara:strand:- start:389 stop:784 length:396 start_codon:yes stop_codon:yes gene_type:complete
MEKIKEFLKKDIYKKIKVWHLLVAFIVIAAAGGSGDSSSKSDKKCLMGTWGYPSANNANSAWSFDKDGTFLFTTTVLGGGRSTGEWTINDDKVHITYTSNSNGYDLDDQTLTLSDCNTLKVGETAYEKDNN